MDLQLVAVSEDFVNRKQTMPVAIIQAPPTEKEFGEEEEENDADFRSESAYDENIPSNQDTGQNT